MPNSKWTDAKIFNKKLQSLWDSGQLLTEYINPSDLFPLRLPCSKPNAKELLNEFSTVKSWVDGLKEFAQTNHFQLEWVSIEHRQLGRNELPCALVIPDIASSLRFLGKTKTSQLFKKYSNFLLNELPLLSSWVVKYPFRLLALENELVKLICFIKWRISNPVPNIYLRQLSLPGLNTKFLEQHQKICSEWLDICLPEENIKKEYSPGSHFALRYGFLEKPTLVRIRILDKKNAIQGLCDLSIPVDVFCNLHLTVARVYIIENDINALAFPDCPESLVLFGRGYGFEYLSKAYWLHDKQIFYWGDIDTHGFAILNQLRHYLPQAQSMLMDEYTLLKNKNHWSFENKQSKAHLSRLHLNEEVLYKNLQNDVFGKGVRLEQEYITFNDVIQTYNKILAIQNNKKQRSLGCDKHSK